MSGHWCKPVTMASNLPSYWQMTTMKKIFISLMTGIAIGILIAPDKGAVTRRKLVKRFNDFSEDISEEANDLYTSGKNLMDEVRADVQGLKEGIKNIGEPL